MSCKIAEYGILDCLLYKMKPSKGGISNQKKVTEIGFTVHIRSTINE